MVSLSSVLYSATLIFKDSDVKNRLLSLDNDEIDSVEASSILSHNSIFYVLFVGVMFCTILGNKNNESSIKEFCVIGKRYIVNFLVSLIVSRILLVTATLLSTDSITSLSLSIAAAIFFALGLMQIIFIAWKVLYLLWQQSVYMTFRTYDEMHDFYRLLATTCYAIYTFILYVQSNQIVSPNAVYYNAHDFFINYLIGVTVFVIFLNVIEERCYLREVELKEEKLQTRSNLMRYISHEIRSPLNTVFMGLQLMNNGITGVITSTRRSIAKLREDTRSISDHRFLQESFSQVISSMKEQLDNCDMAKDSASMALEALNDMLTIDKIDENKLDLAVEDLNVWKFVSEAVRPLTINAIKAQIMFSVDCVDMDLDWMQNFIIKADKFKLNQVLRNFVSNALKFCARSNGEVKVVVERKAVPGNLVRSISSPSSKPIMVNNVVRVSVSDNGFALVELHGGVIGAVSEEGRGSTFFFELPLYESQGSDNEVSATMADRSDNHPKRTLSLLESDIESGDLTNHKPLDDIDGWLLRSIGQLGIFLPRQSSSTVYPSFSLPSPSSTDNMPQQLKTTELTSSDMPIVLGPADPAVVVSQKGSRGSTPTGSFSARPRGRRLSEYDVKVDIGDISFRSGLSNNANKGLRNSLHFLIVDDTAPTRKLMRRMLTSAGHTMGVSAADGSKIPPPTTESSQQQLSTAFDVILMDDNMPNMSGPEATAAIRAAGYTGLIFGVTGNTFAPL
eukprot:gene35132-45479_t